MQAVKRLLPGQVSRAAEQLDTLEELSRQSLAEVRQVVRTMAGETPGEAGIMALRALVSEFAERTGVAGRFSTNGPVALDPCLSPALFRILQESLTNSRRHSDSSYVAVDLTVEKGKVILTVENDGAPEGCDAGKDAGSERDKPPIVTPGFGLRGMVDRCVHLGGTLHYGFVPGGRFRVEAVLPLVPADPKEAEGVEGR